VLRPSGTALSLADKPLPTPRPRGCTPLAADGWTEMSILKISIPGWLPQWRWLRAFGRSIACSLGFLLYNLSRKAAFRYLAYARLARLVCTRYSFFRKLARMYSLTILHRCPKQTSLLFTMGVKPRRVAHSIFTTQRSTNTVYPCPL